MKKILFYFIILIAMINSSYGSDFCNVRSNKFFAKEVLSDESNHIAFRNTGGIANGGVCWWHSRFLRNATYIADFRPNLPKPTFKEMKKIIKRIKKGKSVVIVPGFHNLNSFSSTYRYEIQDLLNKWQLKEGLLKQTWIIGLRGSSVIDSAKLKIKMDVLYGHVKKGNISYQKLQIAGITAHAWLVIDMKKNLNGYTLKVVDSNYVGRVETYQYTYGAKNFNYRGLGSFVPYTEKKKELLKLQNVVKKHCQ